MRRIFAALSLLPLLSAACSAPPPADDSAAQGSGGGSGATTSNTGGSTNNGTGATGTGTGGTTTNPNLSGPPFGHPDDSVEYPTYEGFTLWLAEEFNEPLDLDSDPIWTWSDGGLGEGQVRFAKEGIQFQDGKMMLVVDEAAKVGADTESCSHAEVSTVFSKPLISGEMRTRANLFRYGRYEVRMKAPTVQPGNTAINGNYVATMFVFRTPKFEDWRELDIEVTGDGVDAVTTNLITANDTFTWSEQIAEPVALTVDGMNVREEFHDFAFEWLPDGITWYVDGQVVREKNAGEGLPIPEKSAKIMMNLWIFNATAAFGGKDIANNQYPMHSEYEWFRFYKWDGDDAYPCDSMDVSCLGAEDTNLSSNNPCDGLPQEGQVAGKAACTATCN